MAPKIDRWKSDASDFILTLFIPVPTWQSILPLLKLYIVSSATNTKDDSDIFKAQEEISHYACL